MLGQKLEKEKMCPKSSSHQKEVSLKWHIDYIVNEHLCINNFTNVYTVNSC